VWWSATNKEGDIYVPRSRSPFRNVIVKTFMIAGLCCVALLAAPHGRFFDSAGIQIHFLEEGVGQPVVLLHGYTNNAENWIGNGVFTELAKSYHVMALDVRGHGKSDKPHDASQYGREMGRDVIRLLDFMGIERAHIIGYSMGAQIAAQLVSENPARFRSCILGGASGRWTWSPEDDQLAKVEADEMQQRMLRSLLIRVAPSNAPRPTEEQIREESARRLAGLDTNALAAVRRSMRDTVVSSAQIAAIKIPMMGIVGSADPAVKDFRQLQKLVPQLRLEIIEGASHAAAPTRPEFIRAVLNFLNASRNPQ
jgi:pimeloyl-ACP methyl ester carboxylesterase